MKHISTCGEPVTLRARSYYSIAIVGRLGFVTLVAALVVISLVSPRAALAQADPLPSWNDGPAKQAILNFVKATTDQSNPDFVQPEARIATFDQDGTLWVEHPMYSQVQYCLERVPALVKAKPELANVEPFKTVMSGDRRQWQSYRCLTSKKFSMPRSVV